MAPPFTDLLQAAIHGDIPSTRWILDVDGQTLKQSDDDGRNPAMLAAFHGHADLLAFFIERGFNLCEVDHRGHDYCSLAAMNGHAECLELLIQSGAPFDNFSVNDNEWPLYLAAINGHVACLALLIHSGADPFKTNKTNASLLTLAASFARPQCIDILLKAGLDPNHHCNMGWSPLRAACQHPPSMGLTQLLAAGGTPNFAAGRGNLNTPLMTAAHYGNTPACSILLSAGADPHARNADGASAMEVAQFQTHFECSSFIQAFAESLKIQADLTLATPKAASGMHVPRI